MADGRETLGWRMRSRRLRRPRPQPPALLCSSVPLPSLTTFHLWFIRPGSWEWAVLRLEGSSASG